MTANTGVTTDELLGLFPPGTGRADDGTLTVGGCRLDEVAEQFGTPAIVVPVSDPIPPGWGCLCSLIIGPWLINPKGVCRAVLTYT